MYYLAHFIYGVIILWVEFYNIIQKIKLYSCVFNRKMGKIIIERKKINSAKDYKITINMLLN